jgi:hypothetical protein
MPATVPSSANVSSKSSNSFLDPPGVLAWLAGDLLGFVMRGEAIEWQDQPSFGHRRASPCPHHREPPRQASCERSATTAFTQPPFVTTCDDISQKTPAAC